MSKKQNNNKGIKSVKKLVKEFLDTTKDANAPEVDLDNILKQPSQKPPEESPIDVKEAIDSLKSIYNEMQPKGSLSGPALEAVQKAFKKNNL